LNPDDVISYLLDQDLIDRPKKDEIIITDRGIVIYKSLKHIIESDGIDVS